MEKMIGKNIYLRPITEDDTELIINWRNSDVVRPYFIYQKPFTKEGHEKWLETMIRSGLGYQFIVCRIEDDVPVGCTYFRDYDREHNKIEYGVYLGLEGIKGKGIGTEILGLMLHFAFDTLGVHKVFARALSDNQASIKSFLKGGFEKEGYLKDDVLVNGQYRDIVLLGKINPNHTVEK